MQYLLLVILIILKFELMQKKKKKEKKLAMAPSLVASWKHLMLSLFRVWGWYYEHHIYALLLGECLDMGQFES